MYVREPQLHTPTCTKTRTSARIIHLTTKALLSPSLRSPSSFPFLFRFSPFLFPLSLSHFCRQAPPLETKGSGECCKLPSRVWRKVLGDRFLCILRVKELISWQLLHGFLLYTDVTLTSITIWLSLPTVHVISVLLLHN